MQPINTVAGQELIWTRVSKSPLVYELRAGDITVAALRWQHGSLAEAETADGQWTFKRAGFWHPRVTVRVPGSDADVALFAANWHGGGSLHLAAERQFAWSAANFWHSQWAWKDAAGLPLMTFTSKRGTAPAEGQAEVALAALDLPELSLLAPLGWYLLLLQARDDQAATVAAIVPAISAAT
jgi:hypothetical protein